MSHLNVYIFTAAETAGEAADDVGSWLEDYAGKEFYDSWDVIHKATIPVEKISQEYIKRALKETRDICKRWRERAFEAQRREDKCGEGIALRHVSNILCESLCEDMPWFNKESWNWHVPSRNEDADRLDEPYKWWAVKVDFHY